CCGAVFVFDPKLGMARDWDLFSFVGPPLALACFYFVLDAKVRSRRYVCIALMMTVLGFLMLFPRAISQTSPDLSVTLFNNYAALNKTRNMYGRTLLKKFYDNRGDVEASEREYKSYVTDYPEFTLNRQGLALMKEGKCVEAIALYRKAIDLHPTFVAPFANMGMCYGTLGQADSAIAYLRIASGMNPYNWRVWNNLATSYYLKGDYTQAERCLLAARKYGPDRLDPLVGLVQVYKQTNNLDNWLKYLNLLVAHENAPLIALTMLAEYHLNYRRFPEASVLYRRAIPLGLDSAYLAALRREYPQLGL
ncbi:MAG: tetratricopeptide repeat protein, partial [candidate division Zixibacteria bacterium]|nr:tetratricopeptide repeat protein [candidate division Zixibacteria bacterium]